MTLEEYRTTYAWQSSLDLSPHLVRIAEQLPVDEAFGLGAKLRSLAAELPASVATDLVTGSRTALGAALQTAATLEVIEHVYPALDTVAARSAIEDLSHRIMSDKFTQTNIPAPATVDHEYDQQVTTDTSSPGGVETQSPLVSNPLPEPVLSPAVIPEPVSVNVPVVSETPHVYPNSPQ
jgi:hypothetical protein